MKALPIVLLFVCTCIITLSFPGCTKQSDLPPIDTTAPIARYMPLKTAYKGVSSDSFLYNKDNSLAAYYYVGDSLGKWEYKYFFSYNSQHQCVFMKCFARDTLWTVDSMVYSSNSFKVYRNDLTYGKDTIGVYYNNNKLDYIGSKDTVERDGHYSISYTEYTYDTKNNLTSIHYVVRDKDKRDDDWRNLDAAYNYTFDDKPGFYYPLFINNIYFSAFFTGLTGRIDVPVGPNNLKSRAFVAVGLEDIDLGNFVITNVYDPQTEQLHKQTWSDKSGRSFEYFYSSIRIN